MTSRQVDAEPDHRGLVADGVDGSQRARHRRGIAEVGVHDRDVVAQVGRSTVVGPGQQRIEHDHLVASCDEFVHDVGADEPGAARHERPHHGDRTNACTAIAHVTFTQSHVRRAEASSNVPAVATAIHGMKGSQIRSTSAFERPLTSAIATATSAAPTSSQSRRSRKRATATQTAGPSATSSAARFAARK